MEVEMIKLEHMPSSNRAIKESPMKIASEEQSFARPSIATATDSRSNAKNTE